MMGSCSRTALKILKLCISSWQIADMISDAFNTANYLNLASGETDVPVNYTVTSSANNSATTQLTDTVPYSYTYFYCSLSIWFAMPLLFLPVGIVFGCVPTPFGLCLREAIQ